jgi:hypothetical protein
MESKIYLIILCFVCCIGCSLNHFNDKVKKENAEFTKFLDKFDTLKLPFNVFGLDLVNYTEKSWIEKVDTTMLIANPLLKPINENEYNFIKSKSPSYQSFRFYGVSKIKAYNNYLAVTMQKNLFRDEYWLRLNILSNKGELIDTLTFAGQKVGLYNLYGKIDFNMHITTCSYHDIKEDSTNIKNFYATEIRNEYNILKSGNFKLLKSEKERGYFTTYGERNVVSRVDTVEGKYRH